MHSVYVRNSAVTVLSIQEMLADLKVYNLDKEAGSHLFQD